MFLLIWGGVCNCSLTLPYKFEYKGYSSFFFFSISDRLSREPGFYKTVRETHIQRHSLHFLSLLFFSLHLFCNGYNDTCLATTTVKAYGQLRSFISKSLCVVIVIFLIYTTLLHYPERKKLTMKIGIAVCSSVI